MTILALPLGLSLFWVLLALVLPRARGFARARLVATVALALSAAAAGAAWLAVHAILGEPPRPDASWQLTDAGFLGITPVIVSLIGVVAIALSDSISHDLGTLRRILGLLAVAAAFVAVHDLRWLALLWAISPLLAWSDLRSRFGERGVARLFAFYHGPSVALFVAAALLAPLGFVTVAGLALVAAIGIREAVIPGHSWFPRFVERAPLGLVVAFVAPQLGVYAHVQLLGQSLGGELGSWVATFGAFTAIVAAALGVVQSSARRTLAYLLMSQTGLVSFGLEGSSEVARAGSLLAWQVLAIATSGFAMTVSALEARRGPLSLSSYTGCFSRTPRMAAGFMVMGLASVGFPLTLGFIAEDLLVQGAVEHFPVLAFALIGATALNGMTVMRAFFRLFSGRRLHTGESDLTLREAWTLSAVLLVLLIGGIGPGWITARLAPPSEVEGLLSRPGMVAVAPSASQEEAATASGTETSPHHPRTDFRSSAIGRGPTWP